MTRAPIRAIALGDQAMVRCLSAANEDAHPDRITLRWLLLCCAAAMAVEAIMRWAS